MKNHRLHVIMPMAGEGSRFKEAGIDTPKPLIEFNKQPLFVNAMKTVEGLDIATMTFIVRKEHIDEWHIDEEIKKYYPDAIILSIEKSTRGAADTAWIGVYNLLKNEIASFTDSVIIMDCDVMVESNEWKAIVSHPRFDGVLLSFDSSDERYSYAEVVKGKVKKTAEKSVISNNAITSPYFIKKLEDYVDNFHEMEKYKEADGSMTYKEMYVSVLYNFLIANGGKVILVKADKVTSLGTPEELEKAR